MTRSARFLIGLVVLGGVGIFARPAAATVLTQTTFAGPALPVDWVALGRPWTLAAGAVSPSTGGFGTILCYRRGPTGASALDQKSLTAEVELLSPASVFALCTQGTYGTIAEVDGPARVLRFFQSWSGGVPTGVLGTRPIPFPLRAGGIYEVRLERTLGGHDGGIEHLDMFSLTDRRTGQTVRYPAFFGGGTGGWPGHLWGPPGIMFRSGRIRVREFTYATPFPVDPILWIGGDSFVEGDSIATAKDRRFAQLAAAALGGRAVLAGGGGNTSGELLARLPMDLEPFRPRYCLILIGANDTDFGVWRGHVQSIIAGVRARRAGVIFGTLAPRAPRQAFLNRANAWIRHSGEIYVDFAAALTLAGDGVNWNPALARGDGVHPNLAGHAVMLAQLRRDAPFLFRPDPADPSHAAPPR